MDQAPSAIIGKTVWESDEDDLDAAMEAQDLQRKSLRESARENKVSRFLGEKFFRVRRTWPCLYWKLAGMQLSVELYFPRLNLAVDRFTRPTSEDRQAAAFKAAQLKAHGVKYKALFPENRLADLKGV